MLKNEIESSPAYSGDLKKVMQLANLQKQIKYSGRTFYWIAGLSVFNSLVAMFGGGLYFVIGLGVTLLNDGFVAAAAEGAGGGPLILVLGFLFNLIFVLIFVFFGYYAAKGHRWAFILGMLFYGLDSLLMLFYQQWIGFLFHLYFLWAAFKGLQALGKLERALAPGVGEEKAVFQSVETT
jgi:hypothetical protein